MSCLEDFFSQSSCWEPARRVLKSLEERGFEAFLVGGVVRDALLKKPLKDFDIATSASPEEVLKIFPKAKGTWKKWGVVLLPLKKGESLQITTFRKDHSYKDGRRPIAISYSSLAEDASRRDFTINALYYSLKDKKVLDLNGGQKDLKKKLIRTLGKPQNRFEEDKLRPLRALRFAHQLQFSIEKETQKPIIFFSKQIKVISKERIESELLKMFSVGRVGEALKLLKDYQFFNRLFPSFKNPQKYFSFWNQKFSFYEEPSFVWALVGLPYFLNSPRKGEGFLKSLKAPSSVTKKSLFLMKGVSFLLDSTYSPFKKFQIIEREKLQIKELVLNWVLKGDREKDMKHLFKTFDSLTRRKGQLPRPLVTSADLLKRRIPKKKFGITLEEVFAYQVMNRIQDRKKVLRYLEKIIS